MLIRNGMRKAKARPASVVSIVLALATLALTSGRAVADGVRVEAGVRVGDISVHGGYEQLVPVPRGGLEIDLWSDPGAGASVRPGQSVELFFRTNADCYVTLVSIDPAGRARRLYPTDRDDGWVRGGHVYRLPDSCDDFDLRVSGPAGEERVFALASYTPLRSRYPRWMVSGGSGRRDLFDDDSLYRTGWVTGDAVYEFGVFCERLVPEPRQRDAYSSAWVTFRVGGWHPVRSVCPVCGGLVDGGRVDGCVEVHWYADHGHIDFRADRRPIFRSWACGCSDRRGAVVIRIPSPHRDRDDHHDGHWGRDTDRHDRREVRGEPEGRVRRELGPDPKARSEGGRKAKGHDR